MGDTLLSRKMHLIWSAAIYDAIVTVRLEDRDATFALEYERTAKSEEQYGDILNKFDAEDRLDRFLYLAPSEDVLRFVSWQFRNSKRHVCFGLLADWYRRLLDTDVFDWIKMTHTQAIQARERLLKRLPFTSEFCVAPSSSAPPVTSVAAPSAPAVKDILNQF